MSAVLDCSECVCCASQTAMTFPDWVAPLDKMLPKLASAVRYALAAAAVEGERLGLASAQKGKPGGKAAPAKKPDPRAGDKVGGFLLVPALYCTLTYVLACR